MVRLLHRQDITAVIITDGIMVLLHQDITVVLMEVIMEDTTEVLTAVITEDTADKRLFSSLYNPLAMPGDFYCLSNNPSYLFFMI
jgi:hypothetical protein